MPNWLWIVVLIAAVLAAGILRERWRLRGIEGFARQRGFVMHSPFSPGDRPPMAALAERLDGRRAIRWGAGLTGVVDGLEIAIAEHECSARGADATGSPNTVGVWHVMIAWLGRDGEWAAWRVRGNLTQANVESLLARLPEARGHLESRQL